MLAVSQYCGFRSRTAQTAAQGLPLHGVGTNERIAVPWSAIVARAGSGDGLANHAHPPGLAGGHGHVCMALMRRTLLLGSALLGCSSTQAPTPAMHASATVPAQTSAPRAPGPCQVRNEGFAGVTVTEFTYDAGRKVRAVERGPSGERQTLWTYDEQGHRTQQVVIDGPSIRTHTFGYDSGVLAWEEVHDAQEDRVVLRRTRSYDAAGLLRERDESRWHEGAFVVVDHHALHYDESRAFVYELRTQTPPDGPPLVHSITVDVDAQGRVTARRVDEGMTGSFERVSLYSYNQHGGLGTLTEMKGDALHTVARHTYDAQARLVRTEVEDGAGKRVGVTTYAFSCPS